MNTQNTEVHIKLWHRDFWLMAIANLLLTMSAYSLVPVLPSWFRTSYPEQTPLLTGLVMSVFGVGMFVFGPLCSYLVQRYRRNHVCIYALLCVAFCSAILWYTEQESIRIGIIELLTLRLLQGALFGLAKMVLTSTLIIDTCESFKRTEANHSSAWFGRFAVSLGPMFGLLVYQLMGAEETFALSAILSILSVVLVAIVRFPFRSPSEDVKLFSLDRFFLPRGFILFLHLSLITMIVGLVFSLSLPYHFYGLLMAGFMLALMAQRFAFRNAELKSEVVTGLLLMLAGLLVCMIHVRTTDFYLFPVLFGMGLGIATPRFLLFFIKLSRHCQRGTSQSTNLLGWETGMALGLFVGLSFFSTTPHLLLVLAVAIDILALLLYVSYTHQWFVKNKNR